MDSNLSAKGDISYHDVERCASPTISGVSELSSVHVRYHVSHDFQYVCNIMNFPGVEWNPVAVYLGKRNQERSRLLKVAFPFSVFVLLLYRLTALILS